MNEFVMVDMLFMALALAAAWAAHYLAQPPPGEAPSNEPMPGPLLATGTALVSWTGSGIDLPRLKPLDETLRRICISSGYRGIDTFREGAKLAYEDITDAFASGDLGPQRHLLSDAVYDAFAAAVADRTARGETIDRIFIGVGCDIVDAGLANGRAWIDVRFVGVVVSATRDAAGDVIVGHPNRVVEIPEIWTFERDLRTAEPNWLLTATEEDE